MTIYRILQVFVLSYTGIAAIFALVSIRYEAINRFNPAQGRYHLFQWFNKLHGKTILLPFRILSVIFLIAWLALALPWVDLFIGTHYISSYVHVDGWTGIKTWFGIFSDKGNSGGYYFFTVFISILGVRGYSVLKNMADILTKDYLAVNKLGQWGSKEDLS